MSTKQIKDRKGEDKLVERGGCWWCLVLPLHFLNLFCRFSTAYSSIHDGKLLTRYAKFRIKSLESKFALERDLRKPGAQKYPSS